MPKQSYVMVICLGSIVGTPAATTAAMDARVRAEIEAAEADCWAYEIRLWLTHIRAMA
jgi:hypothetical protein